MFDKLKQSWRDFEEDTPGERFQKYYKRRHQYHQSAWRKALFIAGVHAGRTGTWTARGFSRRGAGCSAVPFGCADARLAGAAIARAHGMVLANMALRAAND
jgi:hypothetical protein